MIHYNSPRQRQVTEEEEGEITIPSHHRPINKQERVECIRCHKPAARYRAERDGRIQIIYEHRDEPPIASFVYHGKKMYRYRRCSGGFASDASQIMEEAGREEPNVQVEVEEPPASDLILDVAREQQQQQQEPKPKQIQSGSGHLHRPSNTEVLKAVRRVNTEQQKIWREINMIRSILEMMVKGNLELVPKSIRGEGDSGIA
jgi:hypothetical protein